MNLTIGFGGSLNINLNRAQNCVGGLLALNGAHNNMGSIPRSILVTRLLIGTHVLLQEVAGIEAGRRTLSRVHEVARGDSRVIIVHVSILGEYLVGFLLKSSELGTREELALHAREVFVAPRAAVGVSIAVVLVLEVFPVGFLVHTYL